MNLTVAEKAPRVLFFGRSQCTSTQKALRYLKTLDFELTEIISKRRGETLPEEAHYWDGELILCIRSLFVLPKDLLNRAKVAAINFHPAPAEYPGSGCLNFALYEQAEFYGVTAHLMDEKVDSGPILECRRFPILPQDTVDTLLERTHHKLLDLFYDVVADLAVGGGEAVRKKLECNASEKWRGKARKMGDIDRLQTISPDISKSELDKIVRATYTEMYPPVVKLHGYEFVLRKSQGR